MSVLIHNPSATARFLGPPLLEFPFLNLAIPDKYGRIYHQRMSQAAGPWGPIVATRTSLTNLIIQSEDLTTSWTAGETTATANAVANPNDGTVNADKIVETSATDVHQRTQAVTIASDGTCTFAVALLAGERTRGRLLFGDASLATSVAAIEFNLTTKERTETQLVGNPTISRSVLIQIPDSDWFYLLATVNLGGGITAARWGIGLHDGTSYSYAGNTSSGIYAYRPTLVAGSYERIPLIDTTTATRSILSPDVYPDDPFAFIVWEQEKPEKTENEELIWFRRYATIPKPQTYYPGSRNFPKPSYTADAPFNPFDAGATQLGSVINFANSASLGEGTYSAATGIYSSGDGKIYNPVKVPGARTACYATGGTFTLTYKSSTTGALSYSASEATIAAAINGLADIIADGITVTVPANALGNSSTGGGLDIALTGATASTPAITLDATSLTVNLSKNPKTAIISSSYQQIKLPVHHTVTAHGFDTSRALVVNYSSLSNTLVYAAGEWGSIDANTIWVPMHGNNVGPATLAGTYASSYTVTASSTYVGGNRLARTKATETFYLAGVSAGITTIDDVVTPTGLQNPTTFLAALLTPLTGFQSYDSDGPAPWKETVIHVLRNEYVKFEDLV